VSANRRPDGAVDEQQSSRTSSRRLGGRLPWSGVRMVYRCR
jgi:hypothetical protein